MPGSRNVDIQLFLNESRFSPFQWVVFALCFFIVLLDGFDTAAIGFIAPSLVTEWGVPRPALAPVLSAALFGLAAGFVSPDSFPVALSSENPDSADTIAPCRSRAAIPGAHCTVPARNSIRPANAGSVDSAAGAARKHPATSTSSSSPIEALTTVEGIRHWP